MVEAAVTAEAEMAPGVVATGGRRPRKALDLRYQPGFGTIAICCMVLLYAPILVLAVFSFNGGALVTRWGGFGLNWYAHAFANEGFHDAALTTLKISITATIVSTLVAIFAAGYMAGDPGYPRFFAVVALFVLVLSRFTVGGPLVASAVPHAMAYLTLLVVFAASLQPGVPFSSASAWGSGEGLARRPVLSNNPPFSAAAFKLPSAVPQ
jgi:ABC-type spermidine/putrescine transport system permease subunit II